MNMHKKNYEYEQRKYEMIIKNMLDNIKVKEEELNEYISNKDENMILKITEQIKQLEEKIKEYNENLFISIIENTDHIWGKYLFEFIINGNKITPTFDKNVDYKKDYGHVLHYLNYNNITNQFSIIFSIRHYSDNESNNFYYKIYESFSDDLINYYNTNEINFKMNESINSKWFCYPFKFTFNNKHYIICNQDDYGKFSKPIILRKISTSKHLLEEKYKIKSDVTSKLFFNDNKKYIYLNEIKEKNGRRYNEIINSSESLNDYSTHSPSCVELYNVLKNLNISNSDSIIDIGSGKGWALVLFNLFPFKKITGIEMSEDDINICKNNLEILNINDIDIIHQDANEYNIYNDYNYFYFYNPFGCEIFENIIKKITSKNVTIIYNNIHECERTVLDNNNYKLVNEVVGTFRNYFIYKNR
jgi:16S rRNA G527 N7-methylase RsmG